MHGQQNIENTFQSYAVTYIIVSHIIDFQKYRTEF